MSSKSKRFLFWLITLLIPVFILAVVEFGFRISGYSSEGRELFVEFPVNEDYLIANPNYVTRYFPSFEPQIAPNPFRKEKTDSTFRVFVFGGSSTQGFPYNFYYSFAAQLEQEILATTKGMHVEVINLGMTAVNSYVINDLAKHVENLNPDVIIIYAGHNEYYGSFGVGSTQNNIGTSIRTKRLILWLKDFLVYQFIEDLLAPKEQYTAVQRTLMARVVSESNIKKDSDIFNEGIIQFEANIGSVISRFQKRNIPVFIGTVASNLKDQSPLSSYWDAMNAYELGFQFLAVGDTTRARTEFINAKEYDTIRFRAPDAINQKIREYADQEGVFLVDIEKILNDMSITGIADNSLFIDHLHPTEIGHRLMAYSFFGSLVDQGLISKELPTTRVSSPLEISDFEYAFSISPIERLLNGYPFVKGLNAEEELEAFWVSYDSIIETSFADSLGASTWFNSDLVALGLQRAIDYEKSKGDSLSVAQLSYELFHWLSFNEDLLKQTVGYQSTNRSLDEYTVSMILKGLNNGISDSYFMNKLADIYSENGDNQQAEYWKSKADN